MYPLSPPAIGIAAPWVRGNERHEGLEAYIHGNPNRISTSATSTRLAPIAPSMACHCAAVRASGNGG